MFRNLAKSSTNAIGLYLRFGAEFSYRNVPKMAKYGAFIGAGISIPNLIDGDQGDNLIFATSTTVGGLLGATAGAAPFTLPLVAAGVTYVRCAEKQKQHSHSDENTRSLKSAC
jgi:hypothetical protein